MPERIADPVRLIGIGNPWRGDDAAGIILAETVRTQRLPGLEVVCHQGDGASLMSLWEGCARVIMVDALQGGGVAGKLIRLDLRKEPVPKGLFPVSTHAFGILEALSIATKIRRPLPSVFLLFGITGQRFLPGEPLSFDLTSLIPLFLDLIKREIHGGEGVCTNWH